MDRVIRLLIERYGWTDEHAHHVYEIMIVGIGEESIASYSDWWLLDHARVCEEMLTEYERY